MRRAVGWRSSLAAVRNQIWLFLEEYEMQSNRFSKKVELLKQFRAESERQLTAIQNEDTERFLNSVEACDELIKHIDLLQDREDGASSEDPEVNRLVSEILMIRSQISSLIPSLKLEIEKNLVSLKKQRMVQQSYSNDGKHIPSIFFDKKK